MEIGLNILLKYLGMFLITLANICIKTCLCFPLDSNGFRAIYSDFVTNRTHPISDRWHHKQPDYDYPKQGITNFKLSKKSKIKKRIAHGMKHPINAADRKLSKLLTVEDLYSDDKGKNLEEAGYFQGDMKLVKKIYLNAYRDKKYKWTSGIIYYVLDPGLNRTKRALVYKVIQEYECKTCLKFKPATTNDRNYLYIYAGNGCFSGVGCMGGRQELSIGEKCSFGQIIHEFMHSIGFFHEHSRTDRDKYIKINWHHIREGFEVQFEKYNNRTVQDLDEKYDYSSIMHYSSRHYSIDGFARTIEPLQDGVMLGQRIGFSKLDVIKINKLYNCNITKF